MRHRSQGGHQAQVLQHAWAQAACHPSHFLETGAGVVLNQPQFFRRLGWGGVRRSFDAEENNSESLPDFVMQLLRDALPLGFLDR